MVVVWKYDFTSRDTANTDGVVNSANDDKSQCNPVAIATEPPLERSTSVDKQLFGSHGFIIGDCGT